jgi:hypothetical protein
MAEANEPAFLVVAEEETRAEISAVAEALRTLRFRLLGVRASLPVSTHEEAILEGEEEMDFATEVRSTIECVLHDFVEATIRHLDDLAVYQPGERAR